MSAPEFGEVSRATGGTETVTYSQRDMSEHVKLLLFAIQAGDARFGVSAGCTYRDRSGTRGGGAMISREPIYAALFDLVAGAAHFVTTGRKLRHWSDLTAAEQPALFMRQKLEVATVAAIGAPIVWKLVVELYVYAHAGDPYLAPTTVLNPLIHAVQSALAPTPVTGVQDLGVTELVQHAYITGKVEITEGVLRDQAVAVIPVEILCL